ncbi:MAG: HigA family addiction module antitoxin [Planctomycetaceae bacterium]|nr:HigA family addiction module antitoxin [Planctomycetaceae bacterium]
MPAKRLPPIHPGEILLEDFLKPMSLTQYRLAKGLGVSARRINEIVHGDRAITADTALRLARFFGTSELFWLNLQTNFDLETERDRLRTRLPREVEIYVAAKSASA